MDIPTINLARTGANITHLRKAAGLSVHDLQMAFGFNSPQAIYKWQNGTALPTVDNLIALAALLHVRMDDISCAFFLCLCKDTLLDPFSSQDIVAGSIPALPTPFISLPNTAFSICSLFCRQWVHLRRSVWASSHARNFSFSIYTRFPATDRGKFWRFNRAYAVFRLHPSVLATIGIVITSGSSFALMILLISLLSISRHLGST